MQREGWTNEWMDGTKMVSRACPCEAAGVRGRGWGCRDPLTWGVGHVMAGTVDCDVTGDEEEGRKGKQDKGRWLDYRALEVDGAHCTRRGQGVPPPRAAVEPSRPKRHFSGGSKTKTSPARKVPTTNHRLLTTICIVTLLMRCQGLGRLCRWLGSELAPWSGSDEFNPSLTCVAGALAVQPVTHLTDKTDKGQVR